MGYETKLIIGKSSWIAEDEISRGELILEDGEAYRPYLKDEKGNLIKTGKKETWFSIYAIVDLCKCGGASVLNNLDRVNKDESHHWYWYFDGNTPEVKDKYGDKLKPVPIAEVLRAVKEDSERVDYRRFKWALALLKSMEDDPEGLEVLIYGY